MAFLHSVIGDNTKENREHLEKLGYKPNYMYDKEGVLYTRNDISNYYVGFIENIKHECVNCIGNDPLFRAVTAMRDDSDKWQLFTDGVKWTLCYEESILMWRDIYNFSNKNLIHKATLSELQAHFQRV